MGAVHFSLDERLLGSLLRELNLEWFVETGTFRGDTLEMALRFPFRQWHSVELSPDYFAAAQKRFAGRENVRLHLGASPEALRALQPAFADRATLFWLDAHWCVAEKTAGEQSQSPLLEELRAVQQLNENSVLLIDDARLYLCAPPRPHRAGDWPSFQQVLDALRALSAGHDVSVCNDVILFAPKKIEATLAVYAHEHGADWLRETRDALRHRQRKQRGWWPFR